MQFPLTEVGPGILRPLIPILIKGNKQSMLTDGLLDTGADRVVLTSKVAHQLGIDPGDTVASVTIKSATGQQVACKITTVIFSLSRNSTRIWWLAEVAVATTALEKSLWGFKGFLEYFRFNYDGPNRCFTLTAGDNLPAVPPPG